MCVLGTLSETRELSGSMHNSCLQKSVCARHVQWNKRAEWFNAQLLFTEVSVCYARSVKQESRVVQCTAFVYRSQCVLCTFSETREPSGSMHSFCLQKSVCARHVQWNKRAEWFNAQLLFTEVNVCYARSVKQESRVVQCTAFVYRNPCVLDTFSETREPSGSMHSFCS